MELKEKIIRQNELGNDKWFVTVEELLKNLGYNKIPQIFIIKAFEINDNQELKFSYMKTLGEYIDITLKLNVKELQDAIDFLAERINIKFYPFQGFKSLSIKETFVDEETGKRMYGYRRNTVFMLTVEYNTTY